MGWRVGVELCKIGSGSAIQYLYVGTANPVAVVCGVWCGTPSVKSIFGYQTPHTQTRACRECVSSKPIDDAPIWNKAASHVYPRLGGMYSRAV